MNSILKKAKLESQPGDRPPAAMELASDGVLAAALPASGQPPVYAYRPLAAGALTAGIAEPNLRMPEAVSEAVRAALEQVTPRGRTVTLAVPDSAMRVFVLDFDTLPARSADFDPVLRFRLRKSVPFDVERAGLSYQILVKTKTECKILAAMMPGPILAEYEAVVRAAGYEPGAVLPSSLAALAALDAPQAVLMANLSGHSLVTVIANGQDILLYRTIDLPADTNLQAPVVERGIAVAMAYFEDKLRFRPRQLFYAGQGGAERLARRFSDPNLEFVAINPRQPAGSAAMLGETSLTGVTGALMGVN